MDKEDVEHTHTAHPCKMWNTHTHTPYHTHRGILSPMEENDEWIKKMWNTHTLLTHGRCGIHTHTHTTPHPQRNTTHPWKKMMNG